MSVIGSKRGAFWEDNGFLVLPAFFSEEEISGVQAAYDRTWSVPPTDVVVDDLVTGRRCRIGDLDEVERGHHFKVNDLYLTEEAIRNVVLSERMGMVLEELLGDEPAICNTLSFDKGSEQADHLDTLYMTPVSERGLVATWMALEDTLPAAGPLRYYPGSNHIAPYRFSNGSMHTVAAEMSQWSDYMAAQVDDQRLEEQRFMARRGDLFVWHALLLHGGSGIADVSLTRQSLVTHYWTQTDCEKTNWDLRPAPGGWWIKRPPQEVPGGSPPAGQESLTIDSDEQTVDFPASLSRTHPSSGQPDLRERMNALQEAIG